MAVGPGTPRDRDRLSTAPPDDGRVSPWKPDPPRWTAPASMPWPGWRRSTNARCRPRDADEMARRLGDLPGRPDAGGRGGRPARRGLRAGPGRDPVRPVLRDGDRRRAAGRPRRRLADVGVGPEHRPARADARRPPRSRRSPAAGSSTCSACPPDSAVGFVTGGTMANFTCLAAARDTVLRRAGYDVRSGLRGAAAACACSSVPSGTRRSTCRCGSSASASRPSYRRTRQGRIRPTPSPTRWPTARGPTIVVLQAGNIHSGDFDPFAEAVAAAREHGAWVHVDGAFGLWAAVVAALARRRPRAGRRRLLGDRRAQDPQRALRLRARDRARPRRAGVVHGDARRLPDRRRRATLRSGCRSCPGAVAGSPPGRRCAAWAGPASSRLVEGLAAPCPDFRRRARRDPGLRGAQRRRLHPGLPGVRRRRAHPGRRRRPARRRHHLDVRLALARPGDRADLGQQLEHRPRTTYAARSTPCAARPRRRACRQSAVGRTGRSRLTDAVSTTSCTRPRPRPATGSPCSRRRSPPGGRAGRARAGAARGSTEVTGLVPVEYPTTRRLGRDGGGPRGRPQRGVRRPRRSGPCSPPSAATTRSPSSRTSTPTSSGADPKPFLGYSDNTNLLSWLWTQGVAAFYGGSTQVQLGPGPASTTSTCASLRAALLDRRRAWRSPSPGESEDFGLRLGRPRGADDVRRARAHRAVDLGRPGAVGDRPHLGRLHRGAPVAPDRRPASPPTRRARRRGPAARDVGGPHPRPEFGYILRSLGERGLLAAVDAVLVARPAASTLEHRPGAAEQRAAHRAAQRDVAHRDDRALQPATPSCASACPFGHTRPQWILPYGGTMTVDGVGAAGLGRLRLNR